MIKLNNIAAASGKRAVGAFKTITEKFPAQTFLPNRPQADLVKAIGTMAPPFGDKRIFLVTSANGTGKTTAAFNIILNIAYPGLNIYKYAKDVQTGEEFPGFFRWPFYMKFPKTWPKNVWYVATKDALKAIDKKLKEWASQPIIDNFKYDSGRKLESIHLPDTDWDIYFKTIDQDPKTFETADVSIIIFDEPPPYRLFTAAVSRTRKGGIIIIPATPLFEAAWFVDEIIDKVDEDGDKYHQTVNVWTNCIEKAGEWDLGRWGVQKKGNLWHRNIEFQIRNWDPDEVEARRDGEFKYLVGLVYKTYKADLHWLKEPIPAIPSPMHYMYRMIIDPHDRRPPAIIWVRYDKFGRRYIMREWPSRIDPQYNHLPYHKIKSADPLTIRDFISIIAKIEREFEIPQKRLQRIMDPRFGRKPIRTTGRTVAQEYTHIARNLKDDLKLADNWGFILSLGDDTAEGATLAAGHKAVKEILKPMADGDLPLVIDPSCYNVNYAMTHYSYDELTPKQEEKKEVSERVREIGKDFADCVRYDVMVPFTYVELPFEKDPYEPSDYDEKEDWQAEQIDRPKGALGV